MNLTHLPIPIEVIYAGLAGTALALIVATATNRWSLRVFFLLALRLAIGWHFLFEGLYKVESYYTGPTETGKPFTSEPYFRAAPGPIAPFMRSQFSDPDAEIAAKVKAPEAIPPAVFAQLSVAEQAAKCPPAVASQLEAMEENAQKAVKEVAEKAIQTATEKEASEVQAATATEQQELKDAKTDEEKAAAKDKADKARAKSKADAEKARKAAQENIDSFQKVGAEFVTAAKAKYARWVYGADARECTIKGLEGRESKTGQVWLTGPQRLEYLEVARDQAKTANAWQTNGLGSGTGTDAKRIAEFRMDALNASYDLARDANVFIAELKQDLNGGKAVEQTRETTRGQWLDLITMWFLVAVGAMLMGGLFTRLACVMAAGFLVTTYLLHPPFPWFPLPPGTEGNPVFINKNVIEALALLTLACYPTGRWLGLDAIVLRPFRRYKGEAV